MVTVLVTSTS